MTPFRSRASVDPGLSRRTPVPALLAFVAGLMLLVSTLPSTAAILLRDAEIEHSLRELAAPLAEAAGINPGRLRIFVIGDESPNAAVVAADTMIIHSGLLLRLSTPEQVQAVLAHEIAHIANGHLSRRMTNIKNMDLMSRLGWALALAAGVAAGDAGVAAGVGYGLSGAARSNFLDNTRAEEAAADQSAMRYMRRAEVDPRAMLDVFELFRGQELLAPGRRDAYARSHPLTTDRIRAVQTKTAALPPAPPPNPENAYWYARLQGKLSAFLRSPSWTMRRLDAGAEDEITRLRRAVAYHRTPDPTRAIAEVRALVAMKPDDAYYQELEGQILFESRRFDEAIVAYEKAVALSPRQPLILAGYGRALLAMQTPEADARALEVLQSAYNRDSRNPALLRDLARAHAQAGNNGMASLMTAKRYAMSGNQRDATLHARRASGLLTQGTPAHRQAMEILRSSKDTQTR